MSVPKILNLDELESNESDIAIEHGGVLHKMRVLDVDTFIAQQRRQTEHEKKVLEGTEDANDVASAVEIMRDSILKFFPTLPVGELTTTKLFQVFAWLNELSTQLNAASSDGAVEDSLDEAGNDQPQQEADPASK